VNISLEIPQDILDSSQSLVTAIKRELAIQLYDQRHLSIGKARELAELSLWQFRHLLAARQIPVHDDVADLDDEAATIRKLERG
jgi:predicted HTH domain antitoxin